jgi:hypothetical protein
MTVNHLTTCQMVDTMGGMDYDRWTASREPRNDVTDRAAQARAPRTPLRRPTETDAQYAERIREVE